MKSRILLASLVAGALLAGVVRADYLDDIGYTALVAELQTAGKAVPNGAGVAVAQVEASIGTTTTGSTTTYAYLPDSSIFPGVTITNASASAYPAATSWHATDVGSLFYGSGSMASGVTNVTAYLADHWLGTGSLRASSLAVSTRAPRTVASDVVNHSWVGMFDSTAENRIALNRLDYAIERDDFLSVVATNNGTVPQELLAGAYNVISVGLSNGGHAAGTSTVNPAVTFPHLVVPAGATSFATPIVSSAAAMLIQVARSSSTTSVNGDKSEAIKAILMAGATKSELSSWSRTDTAPLDATFGAGQLNVLNSDHVLAAGEQTPNTVVASTGWDFNTVTLGSTVDYSFDLSLDSDVSIALTWNAIYTGANYNALTLSLANLDLALYSVGSGGALSLIQQSLSAENVEYLWSTGLGAGSYVIKVNYAANSAGSLNNVDYALAWQAVASNITAVPEPSWVGAGVAALLVWQIGVRRLRLRESTQALAKV